MPRQVSRQRARSRDAAPRQPPWRRLANPYRPFEILSADQLEAIHLASLRILEELGIEFLSDRALDILARAGAAIDRERRLARLDRGLVEALVGRAPSAFTLTPRNPERSVALGGNAVCFASVGGPPNCADLGRGRRPGTRTARPSR